MCDPGEARTLDPMIKSHLLYQLSYGVNRLSISVAKVRIIFELTSVFAIFFKKSAIFLKKRELIFHQFSLDWLSYEDSNFDRQNQKLQCYHYTIRQSSQMRLIVSFAMQRYALFLNWQTFLPVFLKKVEEKG